MRGEIKYETFFVFNYVTCTYFIQTKLIKKFSIINITPESTNSVITQIVTLYYRIWVRAAYSVE